MLPAVAAISGAIVVVLHLTAVTAKAASRYTGNVMVIHLLLSLRDGWHLRHRSTPDDGMILFLKSL